MCEQNTKTKSEERRGRMHFLKEEGGGWAAPPSHRHQSMTSILVISVTSAKGTGILMNATTQPLFRSSPRVWLQQRFAPKESTLTSL
jgi:hypothetical protein